MNLTSAIELYAGGPGSGCNPQVGKCGRPALGDGSTGFVSPNVNEGMNFDQAMQLLNSDGQRNAVEKEQALVDSILGGGTVTSGVGEWKDGAENSSIIYSPNTDKDSVDYAMAKMGLDFNQKSVISFVGGKGSDAVWSLQTQKDMVQVRQTLDKMGIEHRTLVPGQDGITVHVFDQNTLLGDKIAQAAKELEASATHTTGTGTFLGGNTRDEGRRSFEKIIGDYKKAKGIWGQSDRRNRFLRVRGWSAQAGRPG